MPGPAPAKTRRRRNAPARGEWQPTTAIGWQHGEIPEPPDGLVAASRIAWDTWFRAWFAARWSPDDLPGLRLVIGWFDIVQRGNVKANDVTALVRLMDTYGITPAGQQARRWEAPKEDEIPTAPAAKAQRYGHLRPVG
jgi:hypothetical protein